MSQYTDPSDIVINELLCYILNKIELLPSETIIKICDNFYPEKVVETTKQLLFSLPVFKNSDETLKLTTRKGPCRKLKNLEDIALLHVT